MKVSFKSFKKFVWDYKYIIALLLVLIFIYRYLNIRIIENLENNVSKDKKEFVLGILNTCGFDFNVEVYRINYTSTTDSKTKKKSESNSIDLNKDLLVSKTLIPSKTDSHVILPSENTTFPNGAIAKKYLDGGNLGFAVKVSTTDGSEKKISYKMRYCAKETKGLVKGKCNETNPELGKFKELTDYNFKDSRDNSDITITYDKNAKFYEIKPSSDKSQAMKSYSVGFIYLPSKTKA
jgi:hypothetical protein